ncbi:hypothetical protein AB0H60_33375 [Nocardia rhamnosiphila]|uniref:hypothetical protein n=1 Tax=Nocardia rhamnosiphila TaxID=426716 RepID=UPI0033DAA77B
MAPEQAAQAEGGADMLRRVESMPMRQFTAFLGGAVSAGQLEHLMAPGTTTADAG